MKTSETIEKKEKTPKSKAREWIEMGVVMLLAVAFALFIRFNVGQLFLVSGHSMEPTFQTRDFAIASLLSYRDEGPKIGDIVVVKAEALGDKKLIKRVVGLPGDKIQVIEGDLYRNGKEVKESYIQEEAKETTDVFDVPKGHVFVMGDNRNFSTDSRVIGAIPREDVVGKVVMEVWNNPFKKY